MSLLRRICVAVSLLLCFSAAARADASIEAGPLGDLQLQLAQLATHAPGHTAVMVEDLTTGLSTSVNAAAPMPAASTIKIPVMVEVFRQLSLGTFDLNRMVTLTSADRDWGWGDLSNARVGTRYSVARLLNLMITNSDNTAANMLIRLVGRVHINQEMQSLGLRQTWLASDIRSDGPIRSQLRTSARDMVALLESMAHSQLIDEWSSREMLQILADDRINSLLPAPLPSGTIVAHKTGSLHDTLADVGIVFLQDAPYAIAVMTTNLPSLDAGRRFIHNVSRLAYDDLGRFASWRIANLPTFAPPLVMPAISRSGSNRAPAAGDVRRWAPSGGASAAPIDAALPAAEPEPAGTTP
jgi:beta-lactamase class A